jgi:hypothetical protein
MAFKAVTFVIGLFKHVRLLIEGQQQARWDTQIRQDIETLCRYLDIDPEATRTWQLLDMGKGSLHIDLDGLIQLQQIVSMSEAGERRPTLLSFMESIGDIPHHKRRALLYSHNEWCFRGWLDGD